jgi:hypothetical protein
MIAAQPPDVGHDYGMWGTIPLQLEECPTSQRNAAPLQTESVPHFGFALSISVDITSGPLT